MLTFYSYKGGTGRSMALANIAWILASNGQRVLAIDWDFEAPGLHRYFAPLLADPDLVEAPGLIDFLVHFVEAARLQAKLGDDVAATDPPWYLERADLFRYAVPVAFEFPADGVLDFVGAGRQGPAYANRVSAFDWSEFYDRLGGGTFLEAMKSQLRDKYDYVLIDSRTGLSDTSGICTVQMPDELVVCFTLNHQSITGAAAVAASADGQRRLANGEQGLKIWPVWTRVDLFEKDRLDAAKGAARNAFAPFLWHVPQAQRNDYWGAVEQLYFPYYAYEEVLATIADSGGELSSLLGAYERLTSRLTKGRIAAMPRVPFTTRDQLLRLYQPVASLPRAGAGRFFLSYASADRAFDVVKRVAKAIDESFGPGAAFWSNTVPLGDDFEAALAAGLDNAECVLVIAGPRWRQSIGSPQEVTAALASRKRVVPILIKNARFEVLPPGLRALKAARLGGPSSFGDDLSQFVADLKAFLPTSRTSVTDPDDPHKGQFGGLSSRDRRQLSARVSGGKGGWFDVELTVASSGSPRLTGEVELHLHPSFHPAVRRIQAVKGRASLKLRAWGAFTVGASMEAGATRLELDLAALADAPKLFRER